MIPEASTSLPASSAEPAPAEGWPAVAALAAVGLLSVAVCFRDIWSADFWWQFETGRIVWEQGWPRHDSLSYTVPGAPWTELRWLFCAFQYQVMQSVGPAGLVVWKGAALATAFIGFAWAELRVGLRVSSAAVLSLALLVAGQRAFVRPELVTYAMSGLFVMLLIGYRRRAGRWIYLLPLLQVVWVNCHPLFLFGPLLVGLALAVSWGERLRVRASVALRPLAVVFGGTIVATLVNPYGIAGVKLPLLLFSEMRGSLFADVITELQGPLASDDPMLVFFWILAAGCLLSALANLRRLDPFWTVLTVAWFYLAMLSVRNLTLFCLVAVPFILSNLAHSMPRSGPGQRPWLTRGRRACAGVIVLSCCWYSLELATDRFSLRRNHTTTSGAGIAPHRYPVEAVDVLDRLASRETLFSTLLESSYLVSRGYKVFADPRLEIYGEELFARYLRAQIDPARWQALVDEYEIGIALVNLQSPLIAILGGLPDWRLVDFDSVAAIYRRADPTFESPTPPDFADSVRRIRRSLPSPEPYDRIPPYRRVTLPQPYLRVAELLMRNGRPDLAAPFLDDAEAASPWLTGIHKRRAALLEMQGDYAAMIREGMAALDEEPGDPQLLWKIGQAHLRLADHEAAIAWLERATQADQNNDRAWSALGRANVAARDLDRAALCFTRARQLAPSVASWLDLARVQILMGREAEALEGLLEAYRLAPEDVRVLRDLSRLSLQRGDLPAARAYLAEGLSIVPGDPTLLRLRQLLEQGGSP